MASGVPEVSAANELGNQPRVPMQRASPRDINLEKSVKSAFIRDIVGLAGVVAIWMRNAQMTHKSLL
jgi:hypothetical protein